ncbi:hypothetical protein BJ546DRAFT_1059195 [Cryomyces antarcticus]|uniref:Copper acquisition factor BIM1-like domain-containing protein n=1 Tax=Cryomyces antarcticus TaxID=329879 RepID=A0ABR0M8P7_9PEZI|nr:hypothetical protein LTR60_001421 [Cryomyces antarcticus]KAK5019410.1 hypothetical protein LTR39_000388 [Cryomyces antarcticus]KAK5296595.1 hypothetical protein LTR16_000619 [Cryomyces antarcticus]
MFTKLALPLSLFALLPLASAHFNLVYPAARGFNEDTIGTFPCGGQNTVSSNRTQWPLTGAPIQLNMGHTQSMVQVLLALGNDPGTNFNIVLVPTFQEQGPQNFCMGDVVLPSGLNVTAGMNATIQVVTNGDPSGGLYNCADIAFTSTPLSSSKFASNCQNSTGVTAAALTAAAVNANGSDSSVSASATSASGSAAASGSASATGSAAAATSSRAAASAVYAYSYGALAGVMGLVAAAL